MPDPVVAALRTASGTVDGPLDGPANTNSTVDEPPTKVPKVLRDLKARFGDVLGQQGGLDVLSAKEMNNLSNNFRNHLSGEQRAQHARLPKEDKKKWLAQWVIDPETCQREGYNRSFAYTSDESVNDTSWVTLEQLSGPTMMNSMAHAQLVAADLESQPSRFPSLAAKGIMEYKMTTEVLRSISGTRGEAGVSATTELKSSEYTEVKASIDAGFGKAAPARRPKAQERVDDPLAKEMKEALAKRSALLRQMKRNTDAYETQLASVEDVMIPKLGAKGFPEAMMAFYRDKIAALGSATQKLKEAYAEHVVKKEDKDPSALATVKADMKELDDLLATATKEKQLFDKTHGTDLKKLAC